MAMTGKPVREDDPVRTERMGPVARMARTVRRDDLVHPVRMVSMERMGRTVRWDRQGRKESLALMAKTESAAGLAQTAKAVRSGPWVRGDRQDPTVYPAHQV